jgi:adenylate cyclase
VLEERGEVVVKGKGVMRTWFLAGERDRGRGRAPGIRCARSE